MNLLWKNLYPFFVFEDFVAECPSTILSTSEKVIVGKFLRELVYSRAISKGLNEFDTWQEAKFPGDYVFPLFVKKVYLKKCWSVMATDTTPLSKNRAQEKDLSICIRIREDLTLVHRICMYLFWQQNENENVLIAHSEWGCWLLIVESEHNFK